MTSRASWKRWMAPVALACGLVASEPQKAHAFCGFYVSGSSDQLLNNATQVALMRFGTRTVLSMQNNYKGPPQDFAMVVPVPVVLQKENVKTLSRDVFTHLEQLTSPRLVEYWEQDPCAPPQVVAAPTTSTSHSRYATGSGSIQAAQAVRVEAQFSVGEYDVVILSATESSALETYLHENHYNIPQGSAEALAPYVRDQWKFFVAKIDVKKVAFVDGIATLSPLRFHYDSAEFRLPVRLGLLNAPDAQDLIVYILHPSSRFEVSNYPNVFIPTNLDVAEEVKGKFAAFYATLFDRTMEHSGGKAVVTEYAWSVGGCDPCPGPPMADGEMATLGGDVLYQNNPAPTTYHGRAFDSVVTRLHTRYNKATLTEDLVFREAPNVVGGREFVTNANNELEHGATTKDAYMNAFQARYAVRHPWTGAVTCAEPRRGIWGGPAGEPGLMLGSNSPKPTSATGLASATRGTVQLASVVYTAAPEIDLKAAARSAPSASGPTPDASVHVGTSSTETDAGTMAKPVAPPTVAPTATPTPSTPAPKKNCGCSTPGETSSSKALLGMLSAVCAASIVARRRAKPL